MKIVLKCIGGWFYFWCKSCADLHNLSKTTLNWRIINLAFDGLLNSATALAWNKMNTCCPVEQLDFRSTKTETDAPDKLALEFASRPLHTKSNNLARA